MPAYHAGNGIPRGTIKQRELSSERSLALAEAQAIEYFRVGWKATSLAANGIFFTSSRAARGEAGSAGYPPDSRRVLPQRNSPALPLELKCVALQLRQTFPESEAGFRSGAPAGSRKVA